MKHSVFGCKVNKFYLNKWLDYFSDRGFDKPNAHLMATCVVTDRAKSKWVKEAKKLLKGGWSLYLTGCGAFEKGEAMDYATFFKIYPALIERKNSITLLGEDPSTQTDLGDIGEYELNREQGFEAIEAEKKSKRLFKDRLHTKKFIVIQSGCDTYCTFCLTIYKRGSNRNRPIEDIIEEINEFVEKGGKEIVITGVNLAARGASNTRKPEENKFSFLLESIIDKTSIARIRISSLGPEFLDERFFQLMENERFMPHFHFSLQHFDTEVLKKMNRNYDFERLDEVLTKIRALKRKDSDLISIGGDLIVGFPGESQEAFDHMLNCIKKYGLTKMHAFPFSAHQKGETVPAGSLPDQVPSHIKRERMKELLEVSEQVRADFIKKNTGVSWNVLAEESKEGISKGWTPNYIQVVLDGSHQRGDLVEVVL